MSQQQSHLSWNISFLHSKPLLHQYIYKRGTVIKQKRSLLYIKDTLTMTQETNSLWSKYFTKVYCTTDTFLIEKILSQEDIKLIILDTKLLNSELDKVLEKVQMQKQELRLVFQDEKKELSELLRTLYPGIFASLRNTFATLLRYYSVSSNRN